MHFKSFLRELNGKRVEGELIKTVFYSLITSFVFLAVIYFFKFRYIESFMGEYGFALFFSALSYAIIVPSVRHVRSYKEMACMSGMMVGMTSGMMAGFLLGFYVASTNGMFVGSVFGMAVGIALGVWNGKCCGLMGAMTAFMLINDHLRATSVIVFAISAMIIAGLHYMIYFEMRETERQRKDDHFMTVVITFILMALTTWLIVFGPRTGIFV